MLTYKKTFVLLIATCATAIAGCKKEKTPDTEKSTASVSTASNASQQSPLLALGTAASPATVATSIPTAPAPQAKAFILMDAASGAILAENNSNARVEPASLTKLMTSYIVFDALKIGKLKLSDIVTISEHAWKTGGAGTDGSTSFLPIGAQVPVEILLQGMIVQSGNDAAIALAERVAGNETTFAQLMNVYAQRLHMDSSHFANASGLPSPDEYTTTHDLALLAQGLVRDFPEYYHYFSEKEFLYNGKLQQNRNGLLQRDPSVDGIKTGHTQAAGYCLISSAKREGMRLISVVMSTPSFKAREEGSMALLNYGFSFYETKKLFTKDQALKSTVVRKGVENTINAVPANDIVLTIPRGRAADVHAEVNLPAILIAPLDHGTAIGSLTLTLDGKTLGSYDVYPTHDVAQAGIIGRSIDSIRLLFSH
ncbi:MAG TPA: D-alanyl-D-alanine carboxypeptidase family protein [Steroidobacteraceae bacterium]|nr:D-alanyl-D-alanine carboxypeptidase family protein [Steroidobacteraceae bacterium]